MPLFDTETLAADSSGALPLDHIESLSKDDDLPYVIDAQSIVGQIPGVKDSTSSPFRQCRGVNYRLLSEVPSELQ